MLHQCHANVKALEELGVDMVMPMTRTVEEMQTFRELCPNPKRPLLTTAYFNGPTVNELHALGFQAMIYPLATIVASVDAVLRRMGAVEAFVYHERFIRDRPFDYGEDVLSRLLSAQFIRAVDYAKAMRLRRRLKEEFARAMREDRETLMQAAEAIAEQIKLCAPLAVQAVRRIAYARREHSPGEVLELTESLREQLVQTEDAKRAPALLPRSVSLSGRCGRELLFAIT